MKRVAIALFLLMAVSMLQAGDMTLRIVGDARPRFQTMMKADELRNGMNLVQTDQGIKLWANLKKHGAFSDVEWVMTDAAGKTLPSSFVTIEGSGPHYADYPGQCYRCTEPTTGPRVCTPIPCPVHVPCCQDPKKPMRCCID